ncbi:LTA synthase family protein [Ravibacter arvi]|uniref:LTA synthase family protein n=1 Tax=Ravibacter arvi TaxID=2051041 RepID=UPI0031EA13C9
MISRLRLFIALWGYWLIYMIVIRLVFLMYNADLSAVLNASELFRIVFRGFHMDVSMAGYYLALYGLLLTFSVFFPSQWASRVLRWITVMLLVFSGAVTVVDLELYRHWGFRINNTPFMYLGPGAFGSISFWVAVKGTMIFFGLLGAFLFLYNKWIAPLAGSLSGRILKGYGLLMLLVTGGMILPIRGSFTVAPMNEGMVYFHASKPYANHAAINVVWNFVASMKQSAKIRYPEDFYDPGQTQSVMSRLYSAPDSTTPILKPGRPNVLLIIMEGFTSGIIEPLGGLPGITPALNRLCGEGILFTHFYASGDRTDKGVVSILSGYPAQTQTSIVKFPGKTENLPYLSRELKNRGYHTSFLYGGDADFANLRSYLTNARFDHLTDLESFPKVQNTSKWGVHDHFMFERLRAEMDTARMPFFKTVLTLSSHEPFDVPLKSRKVLQSEEDLYLNACTYTDKYLGEFIGYAKKQPWWNSTLIVITADHGHRHPGNRALQDEQRFRIPLLLLGGALSVTPHEKDILGGQTDIANTILAQTGGRENKFAFSKDLLNPAAVPFSAFFFQNGYGFMQPGKGYIYDHIAHRVTVAYGDTTDLGAGKAYQQALFSDYNRR